MLEVADWGKLLSGAVAIALVSFTDISVLSRTYDYAVACPLIATRNLSHSVCKRGSGTCPGFAVSTMAHARPWRKLQERRRRRQA